MDWAKDTEEKSPETSSEHPATTTIAQNIFPSNITFVGIMRMNIE